MRYVPPMAESKTKPTSVTAAEFIAGVPDQTRRADAEALVQIFQRATGEPPVMWGPSIVGFGKYHYKYESGREGDMCLVGVSPRSAALVLYARSGADGEEARLAALGKYKGDKGCLYVKRLADINVTTLEELVRASANHTRERAQCDVCVTNRSEKAARRAVAPKKSAVKKSAVKKAAVKKAAPKKPISKRRAADAKYRNA